MKRIGTWFAEYGADHRDPTNQKIHYVCVPLIFFSTIGLLMTLPTLPINGLSWALIVIALVMPFYILLDLTLAMGMLIIALLCFSVQAQIDKAGWPLLAINLAIFALAWAGQAYGHRLEGKRPSFMTDLAYLLIGPLWILHKLLNKLFTGAKKKEDDSESSARRW